MSDETKWGIIQLNTGTTIELRGETFMTREALIQFALALPDTFNPDLSWSVLVHKNGNITAHVPNHAHKYRVRVLREDDDIFIQCYATTQDYREYLADHVVPTLVQLDFEKGAEDVLL